MDDSPLDRLLLIDDEEGIRRVMRISLQDQGYQVWTAASGEEGLELFASQRPAIVLCDIKMPGMDGIEVLRRIKEMDPEAEVIMITGHGEMELAIKALQLEASDFITKPIHDQALDVALRRAQEKSGLKRQVREYTSSLEQKVRQATAELQRLSDFQTCLIDNALDGIIGADAKGEIVVFNRSAEQLTGYRREEVVGRLGIDHFYEQPVAEWLAPTAGAGERPLERQRLDTTIKTRSGERVAVRLACAPLHHRGEVIGWVTFFQDLREVQRLERRLVQSERLAATGQTVAGLAHAIKNIVGGLKGGMFVVNKGFELERPEYLRQGWDMVQRNIGKISSLAMDLLTYCKERQPQYQYSHPNEVAAEVVELARSRAAEFGVTVEVDLDDSLEPIAMDGTAVHQCLLNLVHNAIDACRPELCGRRGAGVVVRSRRLPDGGVCLEVEDSGCGIAPEHRPLLFTTLFSTKGAEGTGLGLLNVHKIVTEHQGQVEVESEPGRGSRFRILLPPGPQLTEELDRRDTDAAGP